MMLIMSDDDLPIWRAFSSGFSHAFVGQPTTCGLVLGLALGRRKQIDAIQIVFSGMQTHLWCTRERER